MSSDNLKCFNDLKLLRQKRPIGLYTVRLDAVRYILDNNILTRWSYDGKTRLGTYYWHEIDSMPPETISSLSFKYEDYGVFEYEDSQLTSEIFSYHYRAAAMLALLPIYCDFEVGMDNKPKHLMFAHELAQEKKFEELFEYVFIGMMNWITPPHTGGDDIITRF